MATDTLEHKLTANDIEALASLDEHPDMRAARSSLLAAEQQLPKAQARVEAAEAEITAAERAAAVGKRDDRRMQTAQAAKATAESEVRIATHVLEAAASVRKMTYDLVCTTANQTMTDEHFTLVRMLDDKLEEARVISHRIAALEEASERLFAGGAYRPRDGHLGRPLMRLAWWKEFGGPRGSVEDTRLGYWRVFWRKYAASLGYR